MEPEEQEVQQDVNEVEDSSNLTEEPVEQDMAEETAEDTQVQPEPTSQETQDDLDERGVPWKNVAMEYQRKLQEIPQTIRQTVEEALKSQAPKEQEYTIEQLETFASDNPQHRPWVESKKAEIIQKNLEKSMDNKLKETERKSQEAQIRQQSEQWVVNHPKFKDCFTKDVNGNPSWNMSNPLTQVIGNYLNTVDPLTGRQVKDRADGIQVAAKMAYADYVLNQEHTSTTQATKLKRELRNVQKKTMVTGGGKQSSSTPPKSAVRKSLDNYNKTYRKSDVQDATKAYLIAAGLIKSEE